MNTSFNCVLRPAVACLLLAFGGNVLAGGLVDPDFDWGNFDDPLVIDNWYWPLSIGTGHKYLAEDDDECEVNTVTPIGTRAWGDVENDDYDNVEALEVLDKEWAAEMECDEAVFPDDFDLMEVTLDWYAQDNDQNIWYLGEYTIAFDHEDECDNWVDEADPELGCTDGSFEAGVDGAEAGIVMLGTPFKGAFYQQEYYEDEAEDMAKVLNFVPVEVDFNEDGYEDCLKTKEWTPLERGEIEHKYYCHPDGLVLIKEQHGGTKDVELIDIYNF